MACTFNMPAVSCEDILANAVRRTPGLKLNYCAVILMAGRSRMPSLYHLFAGTFKDNTAPFTTHTVNQQSANEVPSKLWPVVTSDRSYPTEIFVDASSSWGIGFVWNDRWLAWKLLPGWKSEGRDIGWAEMVAVELAYLTVLASGLTKCHIMIRSDNRGVIGALRKKASRNPEQNTVLQRIISYTQHHEILLPAKYVASNDNIADGPSRGLFPPPSCIYPDKPRIPRKLKTFLCLAV